jgi:hypothetical protein
MAAKKQRTHFRLPGPVLDFAKIVYKKYLKQIPTSKLSPTKMSRHLRDTFKTTSPTRVLKKLFELIDVEDDVEMSESSKSSDVPKKSSAGGTFEKKKIRSTPATPVAAPKSRSSSASKNEGRLSSKSKPKNTERSHKTKKTSETKKSSRRHVYSSSTADDDITLNAERSE